MDHICCLREDEFAVIMTRMTSRGKAWALARIDQVFRALQAREEGLPPVFLRIGVAFPDRENPVGDVFEDADAALRRMKAENKTGIAVF